MSHNPSFGELSHESVVSLHESSVQPTASSQSGAVPAWQLPSGPIVSAPLQNIPSSQSAWLGVCRTRLSTSSQLSIVQLIPSSKTSGIPYPDSSQSNVISHFSAPLQKFPSSQYASFGIFIQVLFSSSQLSSVQKIGSPQSGAVPARQSNSISHVSTPLQKSPSSQFALFITFVKLWVVSSQTTSVQFIPSSSMFGVGAVPAWQSSVASQVSAPSHHNPLSQFPSFTKLSHESVVSLHESSVQPTPSLQVLVYPAWQPPKLILQDSPPLHHRPSSQNKWFSVCTIISSTSSHQSSVQSKLSAVPGGVPAWQPKFASHVSAPLHHRLSSQRALLGVFVQV